MQATSDGAYKQILTMPCTTSRATPGGMKTNVYTCSNRRSIRPASGTSEDSSIRYLSSTIAARRRWMLAAAAASLQKSSPPWAFA